MRRLSDKGYTLMEALVSMVILGMCTLLVASMIGGSKNNITAIKSTRGLYSVMQNVLESMQVDVTRDRDLATGDSVLETTFGGRTSINEINVQRGTLVGAGSGTELEGVGERIYVVTIKTYYKDKPKHFIVDKVVMTKGVGLNAD